MKCNRDNLIFGMYDYGNKKDCEEALECLERSLVPIDERYDEMEPEANGSIPLKPKYPEADHTLEISERGIANI